VCHFYRHHYDIIIIISRLSCWERGAVLADFSLQKYLFTKFVITSLTHVIMSWFDRRKKTNESAKVNSVAEHFIQFLFHSKL